ncbi:phage baseplate plug family protein [Acetobacter orientalis]|uniref:Cyanophage baseplate Pam3 plug gp18 domain-containing protein n=1 Tax=Acetobacter orientalis TaxID=146474 RepID=A0A2Z5ZKK7_9PROT|nr:hypothetical protein [Acetobacter orientalis]BBC80869.1 hypothetical protein AcetOrient_orf03829 [Acetobacter orientalis]GAN66118.1 hypothetical protein Abor_015_041 [Acetobacter orientalis]GEL62492.1 hypothetical protein AOR02nite_23340 [Acetobacter orientalis]
MSAQATPLVMVPLAQQAAQVLKVPLSGTVTQIALRQRSTGLYAEFWQNDTRCLAGILCQDRTWLIRSKALGIAGDFCFIDTQGTQDPTYTGLGSRYLLLYRAGWPA